MKKILSLLAVAALLVTMVGCGAQPAPESSTPAEESTTTTTAETTIATVEDTTTEDTTTTEEETTTTEEATTTTEETTTTTAETTTTTTEEVSTTTAETTTTTFGSVSIPVQSTASGPTKGISTMKGPNKGTVTIGTAPTTTVSTEATTATTTTKAFVEAEPVLDKEYRCYIYSTEKDKEGNTSPILILASVKFSESTCVISRHFYTGNPDNPKIDNTREPVVNGSTTYYFTNAAVQAPARYEVVGITIDVFNDDGSIAKTFSMPTSNSMECSFSDGVAFGRQNTFHLEEN